MSTATQEQYVSLTGFSSDLVNMIRLHGHEMQAEQEKAQKALDAFGFNAQMVQDQSNAARAINRVWSDVDLAWQELLTTAEKPITTQLEKLDKWIKENPDAFKALMILGGGVTAAGGAKVVGGILGRSLFGFGGPAKALTGSAAALTGSARALDAAAAKLAAGGGPGGAPAKVAEAAVEGGGILGWLSRGGPLQWFGKAGATGISWLGGLSAASLLEGLESGNKGIQDTLRRAHPEWTDQQMKDWVRAVQAGNNPDETQPSPAPEQLHDRPPLPPTPKPVDTRSWWQKQKDLWWLGDNTNRVPTNLGAKAAPSGDSWIDKANQIPTDLPPIDANKPAPNATPEEAEVGGGGFRIPGTDQSIGFGDQTVTLKTGGTAVQSGNPLPVRIEKIDPTAGGIGGLGGDGGGLGETGGSGGHGHWGGAARGVGGTARGEDGVPYVARSMTDGTGISQAQYDAFRAGIRDIEGGKYGVMGGAGGRYAGAYQMGPSEIRKSAMRLKMDPNDAQKRFLSDPALQEKLFENYTREHYDQLMRDASFRALSAAEKLKVLATGQLGVPAAERYLHGSSTADGWGTPTSSWANAVARRLREVHPPTPATPQQTPAFTQPSHPPSAPPTAAIPRSNIHIPNVYQGGQSSEYPARTEKSYLGQQSWLFDESAKDNAQQWMASNWGSDTVHHHYDNSDNSMTYHDNRKTNVTVTGATEPHEIARAVGSTLDMAFSPSQAKQRFLQGAIS